MRAVILRTVAVLGAGALVLAGVLIVASTVDGRPPSVLGVRLTQPVGDDEGLALVTTSLEIAFNEPVDAASAEAAVELLPRVDTAPSWSGSTLTMTPLEPLALATEYVVTISAGVRDLAGNVMSEGPDPFTFATVGPPALAGSTPTDGATGVALDAVVELSFTTLMDTVSVEEHLAIAPAVPHELRWSGRVLEIVPTVPLDADTAYRVEVGESATDVAGVALEAGVVIEFRTVVSSLDVATLIPSDGVDGVASASAVAVLFSEPIDPATVEDTTLTLEPAVGGTLEVVRLSGDPATDAGAGRALVFTPSEPLPPNTTFEVSLAPGVATLDGVTLGVATEWTFTTGVSAREISNQVTFLSDRAGVMNVWAMNPDGSGQRQLSVELEPIVDYAVAPDGDGLIVGDGSRLVFLRPDGSERRVITDLGFTDFDPAFSPDGRQVAFARADATTGLGQGLWTLDVPGGSPERLEIPAEAGTGPTQAPSGEAADDRLRAPRYAPDGSVLAFVDLRGHIGLFDLGTGDVVVRPFAATGAPVWAPDASQLLVSGREGDVPDATIPAPPVPPMEPGDADGLYRVTSPEGDLGATSFPTGWRVVAVSANGAIALVDPDANLWIAAGASAPVGEPAITDADVRSAAFAPGGGELIIELRAGDGSRLELIDSSTGNRTSLAADASRPLWLP